MLPLFFPNPVLADADAIGAIVVVVFTVIAWIINLVSNKNQKGPPVASRPRPAVRPRDPRLQEEIDIFIQEASPRKGANRPRPAIPNRPARSAQKIKQPQRADTPPTATAKQSRRIKPGEEIATRQAPVSESLGTGVKQHLSQHMAERVSQGAQQHLQRRVEASVTDHLGTAPSTQAAPQPPSSAAVQTPQPLVAGNFAELLMNPANLRQAIVLNLILSPPTARQRLTRPQ